MQKNIWFSIVISTQIFFSCIATAENLTNREFAKYCESPSIEAKRICRLLIQNTADAQIFYRNLVDASKEYLDICFPENPKIEEFIAVYLEFIKNHPSLEENTAFLGISTALSTKYSCKTSTSSTFSRK